MAAPAVVEVNAHIEKKGIYGLNEAKGCGALALLNGGVARSDVDSQLILCFPFSQTVKLSALVLTAPLDEAPTELRLYVNRAALGFEDLEEVDPAMTSKFRGDSGAVSEHPMQISPFLCSLAVKLSPGDFGPDKQLKLKAVAFQRVNSLHIFFDGTGARTGSIPPPLVCMHQHVCCVCSRAHCSVIAQVYRPNGPRRRCGKVGESGP